LLLLQNLTNFNLRGAVATGFRAPSLSNLFNNTSTHSSGGVAVQRNLNNDSQAASLIGIPELKQEESEW
jgi:iron complex outermembrane receptor protein